MGWFESHKWVGRSKMIWEAKLNIVLGYPMWKKQNLLGAAGANFSKFMS